MREHTCRMNPILQMQPTQPQKDTLLLRLHDFFNKLSAPTGKTGGCAFFFRTAFRFQSFLPIIIKILLEPDLNETMPCYHHKWR